VHLKLFIDKSFNIFGRTVVGIKATYLSEANISMEFSWDKQSLSGSLCIAPTNCKFFYLRELQIVI